jgi:hypothetical protein
MNQFNKQINNIPVFSNPYYPKAPLVAREQVYVSLIPLLRDNNKGIRAGEYGVVAEATKGAVKK